MATKPLPFVLLLVAAACGGEGNNQLFANPGGGAKGGAGGQGGGGSTSGGAAGKGSSGSGTGGATSGGATSGGATSGGAGAGGKGVGAGKGGGAGSAGKGSGLGGSMAGSSAAGRAGGPPGVSGRGGAAGGEAGRAGAGGMAGSDTCGGIATAYADALESALACDPAIDSDQCTEHVAASIPCGCTIHANPANEDAVAELLRLSEQHTELGCPVACTDVECIDRVPICMPSGDDASVGRCTETDTPE